MKESLAQGFAWRTYNDHSVQEYGLAKTDIGWSIVKTSLTPTSRVWDKEVVARGLTDDEAVAYLNLILY